MPNLQTLLNDIVFDSLPPAWTTFDLATFSRAKSLWDYQQNAVQGAIKALWKYYNGENDEAKRKVRFFRWYNDNSVPLADDLSLGKKRNNIKLLLPYYPITQSPTANSKKVSGESVISYKHFINRLGFWMATGSGKTLVIVKLLEVLWTLMSRGLIPTREVMVLTHREDLLKQLRDQVNDFNASGALPYLRLRELREYPDVKRGLPSLLGPQELTVFYYRSDNLSDEQKQRILDFRNYDNNGQWYVLLDEAHKGDKEDSKRQHIYSILSRDGFLFNFSATFTDPRDILTTAHEFNLSSFISSGYGKHLSLLKQENRAFKDKEDFTNEEKQRIVLQSLLMLTYVSKAREQLCTSLDAVLYHRPLMLALVNSVNTNEADLKLFFRELERIGKGEITLQAFTAAKMALKNELMAEPEWLYENECFRLDQSLIDSLTLSDVLRYVFNANSPGDIEVLTRPSNSKELAFKLKSATEPFALIKIGDITGWLKSELIGYEVITGFQDESFFAQLNGEASAINLLMGSRSFYEGWDSNRPNVITFINIGTGADAKKFILQSVGRGVRLEPLPGKRKRLQNLYNAGEVDETTYQTARPFLPAVESLFIFGTKRDALVTIFEGLDQEKEKEDGHLLSLEINKAALSNHPILIPIYRRLDGQLLIEQRQPRKFEIQPAESEMLKAYVEHLGDERLLLARHNLSPQQIGLLKKSLAEPHNYFNPHTERKFGQVEILLPRLTQYFDIVPHVVDGIKEMGGEINHFNHIRVLLKDLTELRKKINAVRLYKNVNEQQTHLKEQLNQGQIDLDEYTQAIMGIARTEPTEIFEHDGQRLAIRHVSTHYYLPILLTNDEKITYINHVIRVPSEVRFVEQIENYLKNPDNLFKQYDWWLFSRTVETVDKVTLPYYDPMINRVRDFHPDFVFWLVKGNQYTILFVDPKGMIASGYQHKIDGYKDLFRNEDGSYRVIKYGDYQVRVALAMHTADANQAPKEYREFWYDQPQALLQKLHQHSDGKYPEKVPH